jgi:hypothetical protein
MFRVTTYVTSSPQTSRRRRSAIPRRGLRTAHQPQRLVAVHQAIVMARQSAQQQSPTLRHDNRTGPSEIAVGDEH